MRVVTERSLTGVLPHRESSSSKEPREDGLWSLACLTMMKLVRKRKFFLLILATSVLTLAVLLTPPGIHGGNLKVELDLTQLHGQLALNLNSSQRPPKEFASQLSNLGNKVVSNKKIHEKDLSACTPVTNIAFVKTHKAGSSTIANILQRFGIKRNLSFALPNSKYRAYGYNYISRAGDILTPSKLLPLKNGSHNGYNILYNHAIYNRTAFRMFMPSDTHYISILREPFSQFVSAFEYYGAKNMFSKHDKSILLAENPISAYLQNPYKFERRLQYFSYIKNKQAEDLGLGWSEYFVPSKLNLYLDTLRSDFTLFMIMEYFDESLLMLKRKLCWDLKDILYIPKNKNKHKPKRNFTEEDHRHHKKMSHLDYKLYTFFYETFEAELKNQSREFFEELAYFKTLLTKVHESCTSGKPFFAGETQWHRAFSLDKADCHLMLISELSGFDLLLERAGALNWNIINSFKTKQNVKTVDKIKVLTRTGGVKVKDQKDKVRTKHKNEADTLRVKSQKSLYNGDRNIGDVDSKDKSVGVVESIDKGLPLKQTGAKNSETVQDDADINKVPVVALAESGVGGAAQAVILGDQLAKDESGIKIQVKDKV